MKIFSRNWFSVLSEFFSKHKKLRMTLLGVVISSSLFGCPFNNNPAINGKVVEAGTGRPIGDALVLYNFSQGKGMINESSASLSLPDGAFHIPLKVFPELIGFFGENRVYVRHPLYESKSFHDGGFKFIRLPKLARTINIELIRLSDKYRDSAVVGYSSLEDELKYNPRFYNEETSQFGLKPRFNGEAIAKEIEELSEKHKILIRPGNTAALLDVLQNSKYATAREKAAESLGKQKTQETLSFLHDCIGKDSDTHVRWQCRKSYWEISGKVPPIFHAEDVNELAERFSDKSNMEFYNRLKDKDPDKVFFLEFKRAFEDSRLPK